ncbi:interleukin-15 receptor subunit alpha isoform X3 [Pseudorasbora parva]|uniref:interleukin-15 receptor subunit alpha isoform X3 n=1 Tax=Pseudorasbora parva TaxID=51549 RepID=UPI00351EAFFD
MHMLGILIFMTAAYQHNLARGSGFCEPPTQAPNTVPVNEKHPVNATVRIKCAEGFVRKAGTSSLIRCKQKNGILSWHNDLPLRCIRDPKKQHTESQTPTQHFTSSTTERTEIKNTTILGTSMPTTAADPWCVHTRGSHSLYEGWKHWLITQQRRNQPPPAPLFSTTYPRAYKHPLPTKASLHASGGPSII